MEVTTPVVSQIVKGRQRMSFLPALFGVRCMMQGEALVFGYANKLIKGYGGGHWEFARLIVDGDAGGGYMIPPSEDGKVTVEVSGNYYTGTMSADAAGIVVTLFALCHLADMNDGHAVYEMLALHYHALRDFACEHAEASAILAAID